MRILFVCLGNICRSPLAQGILERKVQEQGLDWEVDSAGTGHWHVGENPDPRSINIAAQYDLDISSQVGRQFSPTDFDQFDLILTMDNQNYRDVKRMAQKEGHEKKVKLILDFLFPGEGVGVPDPYWDDNGFQKVYDLLDRATDELIKKTSLT